MSTETKTSRIPRIAWKQFLRNQTVKIIGVLIMITLVLIIVSLSTGLDGVETPDNIRITEIMNDNSLTPAEKEALINLILNPDGVIAPPNNQNLFQLPLNYYLLIITSSLLFILVLAAFTKTIFVDHKEDFGIESYKSWRAIFFFVLVISFLSATYLLLDLALVNVFMVIGPVDILWSIARTEVGDIIGFLNVGTVDNQAYSDIRSFYFLIFIVIMLIFPLVMFFIILTRLGRTQLFEREHKEDDEKSIRRQLATLLLFLLAPIIEIILFSGVGSVGDSPIAFIFLGIALILGLWWLYQLAMLIFRTVRFTAWFSFANLLLIFPLILIFYVLPVVLLSSWDVLKIFTQAGIIEGTIWDLANLSIAGLTDLEIISTTIYTNAFQSRGLLRIVELDFIIIVGIAALVIGFAEGVTIIAIFRALSKGVSIARTGRVATTSAPKAIVFASRFLMLGVWFSLLWDKFLVLVAFLRSQLPSFDLLPDFDFQRIIGIILDLARQLGSLSDILLPLAFLILPLFLILTAAFKFLSVTLVVERVKNDTQVFFLLIASAFVLIVTQILQDISATFQILDKDAGISSNAINRESFTPISFLNAKFGTDFINLEFASSIFENLEAGAFYLGVLVAVLFGIRAVLRYIKKRITKEEETAFTKIDAIQKETKDLDSDTTTKTETESNQTIETKDEVE